MTRIALCFALAATLLAAVPAAASAARPEQPNVVVIMTDDQDFRSMSAMPYTRALMKKRGTTFDKQMVSFPLCCPSRATFLTGQYAHNHGVKWNNFPQGGYQLLEGKETLPVWLGRAGYRTIHIGKYLNEYGEVDPTEVPKGWDEWWGGVDPSTYDYYGYTLNHNGRLRTYGREPDDYSTDVYAGLAAKEIKSSAKGDDPFFLSLAPNAPHTVATASSARMEGSPAVPAPRHLDIFADEPMPIYPNFNEADLSDKPTTISQYFPTQMNEQQIAELQEHWRGRMGSLLAVDEMVANTVRTLKETGEWKDTVLVFTSDNGWILGEHRLRDPVTEDGKAAGVKYVPYEGSARVPLMVTGPGFPEGKTINGVTSNADLASTILDLGDAKAKKMQDGMSLAKAARNPKKLKNRGVLLETFENPRAVPPYTAVRTKRYRYDLQADGQEGLYDLKLDPWEMDSVHADPRYKEIRDILRAYLDDLVDCKGKECRAPVPELPPPG
jgi:arylsulfatase A-like enzyme